MKKLDSNSFYTRYGVAICTSINAAIILAARHHHFTTFRERVILLVSGGGFCGLAAPRAI